MKNYTQFVGQLPPCTHEVLMQYLNDGIQWYEVRHDRKLISFYTDSWDEALSTGKGLKKVYESASFYYCWKENGEIHEERIL
jgi:hypothetical protein